MSKSKQPQSLQWHIQTYFTDYLVEQRSLSPQTIFSYRDTFRLLLKFVSEKCKRVPSSLSFSDLDSERVLEFLSHLESKRKNSIRSRNARLAAIKSFMNYVAYRSPELVAAASAIRAIPGKATSHPMMEYLSREEMDAVLSAPDTTTWSGRRDSTLFRLMYNTGGRVSELLALRVKDVSLLPSSSVQFLGKGRKHRSVPLWKNTAIELRKWVDDNQLGPESWLFTNRRNEQLTRSGVENRLRLAVEKASRNQGGLKNKRISPHTFRHSTAMHLLQAGVDITVIALWLGHSTIDTTHKYVEADLKMKEQALNKIQAPGMAKRFKADDSLMAFLERL
jgi:integrase/recombinase XerD